MHNPFRYGVPVSGEYYKSRPQLVRTLTPYALSGQKILLYGPRRFGKSSFVQEYAASLARRKIDVFMVDVYPITSHRDFLHALLKGIRPSRLRSLAKTIQDVVKSAFRLRPTLSLETDGLGISLSIPAMTDEEVKISIEDTLKMIGQLNKKRPLSVFFDEFQKVVEIGDEGWLEGTLRSEIQRQEDVHYLFCGSCRGLILDMFQNASRPFYHMATAIELPRLGDEFVLWLKKRLKSVGITISEETTRYLLDRVDWSPNYAQMIAFHLVANHTEKPVSEADIDTVLDTLCQLNGYTYMTLFDSLPFNAQKVLRLVALHPGKSPFKQDLMRQWNLSSSAVQTAIRSLINKRILDDSTSKGRLVFDDPLLFRWVQRSFTY